MFTNNMAPASLIALALTASLTTGTAQAADVGAGDMIRLEEITVTAQKRSQNVQDVPIAITAFTESMLRAKGTTDLQGLSALTPNVNLDAGSPFSGSSSVLSASIRGIGQDDFAFNLDPGVGVYVDGVYFARTVGANQNLLDVERIEILKGPQGTLFGRNTIGGAISIVTRTPGAEFNVQGQMTIGSYQRRDVSLMADIPLSDTLLTSITFSSQDRQGFQKRVPYSSPTPYVSDPVGAFHNAGTEAFDTQGGQDQQVFRGKVLWKPSDSFHATLSADWTHANQPGVATTVLQPVISGPTAVFGLFYNLCVSGVPFLDSPTSGTTKTQLVCGPRGSVGTPLWNANANPATTRLLYGANTAMTGNIDTTYATGPNFDKMDSYGGSLTLDWTLSENTQLKSITGARALSWRSGEDEDGSPIQYFETTFAEGQHQFSQEFQLLGNALDNRLKYVGGLYFFKEGGFINDYVTFPGGLLQIDGPNSLDTKSYAGFMHADYAATSHLGLTLGARYSVDKKTFTGGQQEINDFFYKISGCYPYNGNANTLLGIPSPPALTCQQALGFPNPANYQQMYPPGQNSQKFSVFTPTLGAQLHLNDDVMTYLSYSKGFKTGGWTTRLTSPLPPTAEVAQTFAPEKDQTYELGIKSEWLDRRLLLNGAVFYSKYDDIQLTYQVSTSPVTANAGNADIKGAELELQSRFSEHFSLNANVGYMDAKYTSIKAGAQNTTGSELPKTPKLKYSVNPEFHMNLASGKKLRLGVDFTHTDSMYNDVQNTELLKRKDTNIVNASMGVASADDKYTLTLGGTNLSDERYLTTGQPTYAGGVIYGTYSAPRQWWLTLRAGF
jgi:iron complex outermembrane receptor protein